MSNPTIDKYESEVRGYCRTFTKTWDTSEGAWLTDTEGEKYLDFFAGAGVLNYGHNHPALRKPLLDYVERGGITHSLDMYSAPKERFLETFHRIILEPRKMNYRVQFPGPTGTNATEAAMKLARKVTGRTNMAFFTNAFHGMTVGSLAVTGNEGKRHSAAQPLSNATPMPFDGYMGEGVDTLDYFEHVLEDRGSGVEMPAGVIVETVQAEGGVNVASRTWMERLGRICKKHGILLIIDDIQVGCGRTGSFFSFEDWDLDPDIVCLSKSLSAYGLPFAVVLLKPEHDIWSPGEHNGTFRGHNLAFITATAALEQFWKDDAFSKEVLRKGEIVRERFEAIAKRHPELKAHVRGRGFIWGLASRHAGLADHFSEEAFKHGLVIEGAGINDNVVKFLAPLVIEETDLKKGLDILDQVAETVVKKLGDQSAA
ncbi:diaminobutyrate-2-oxoglutarate transaminase [Natronospira proteinivora]|uniref:Diaminobutyrate--2-oxoglutarate transaminase n=1 Tax=Natronospira proteinivora TaxID=1807133 RepID=A0ABT1GB00_9GAMM|nr:diaminobutyrate--2-oxoglutarate transaminase [Natronospira proteinivora]MCP1728494.1 diaminobutyrate-2-oxoglutarate transaminase [Natronospira proteinivora]